MLKIKLSIALLIIMFDVNINFNFGNLDVNIKPINFLGNIFSRKLKFMPLGQAITFLKEKIGYASLRPKIIQSSIKCNFYKCYNREMLKKAQENNFERSSEFKFIPEEVFNLLFLFELGLLNFYSLDSNESKKIDFSLNLDLYTNKNWSNNYNNFKQDAFDFTNLCIEKKEFKNLINKIPNFKT